jgi:nucleotide-binding universal stress UspA family protein
MQRIVVGVDGSVGSRRALQWAVDEARLRGASVECVHAWNLPFVAGYPYGTPVLEAAALEQDAERALHEIVAAIDTTGLAAPIEERVETGVASQVIVEAAKGADLLVVGSRGLGGFKGLLLGSVSHQVVQHAPCTVVVVPAE